ncbi:MAG: DUF4315 family protein [Lachnospiraceae bacterium]|nr:DUF4315 family protein [Lachnospiraceae bacterium]
MITTSKKLKKLILEEERTVEKIAELQAFLKEIREARKREEDAEILKSIRGLKLGARDLFDLLSGIQDGTVSMEVRDLLLDNTEDADEENSGGKDEESFGEAEDIPEAEDFPADSMKETGTEDHSDETDDMRQ